MNVNSRINFAKLTIDKSCKPVLKKYLKLKMPNSNFYPVATNSLSSKDGYGWFLVVFMSTLLDISIVVRYYPTYKLVF